MAYAISRQPLTVEARVHTWVGPCEICGGQGGTGAGLSLSSFGFPSHYHSTIALRTYISLGDEQLTP